MRTSRQTIFALAIALAGARAATAETRYVPDSYATIQEAVDAAVAGDTVCVRAGIYDEHVLLNKSGISLVGEEGAILRDAGASQLPPMIQFAPMFTTPGYMPKPASFVSGSEVRGFRIETDAANGVGVFGLQGCRVTGVTILTKRAAAGFTIHSWNEGVEIDHCTIIGPPGSNVNGMSSSGFGLNADPAKHGPNRDFSVHHNEVSGCAFAIRITDCEGLSISQNVCLGNAFGVRAVGIRGGTIDHNTCDDSTQIGLSIQRAIDLVVAHNTSLGSAIGFFLSPDGFLLPASTNALLGQYYPSSDGNTITHNILRYSGTSDLSVAPGILVGEGHNELSQNLTGSPGQMDQTPGPDLERILNEE
jgi:hypothetical protein